MTSLAPKHFIGIVPSLFPLCYVYGSGQGDPGNHVPKMAESLLVWFLNDCVEQRFQGLSITAVSVTLATQITSLWLRIPVAWSNLGETSPEVSYLTSDWDGNEGPVAHIGRQTMDELCTCKLLITLSFSS